MNYYSFNVPYDDVHSADRSGPIVASQSVALAPASDVKTRPDGLRATDALIRNDLTYWTDGRLDGWVTSRMQCCEIVL